MEAIKMTNENIIKELIITSDEYDAQKKIELLKWLENLINERNKR